MIFEDGPLREKSITILGAFNQKYNKVSGLMKPDNHAEDWTIFKKNYQFT